MVLLTRPTANLASHPFHSDLDWIKSYLQGVTQEIYPTRLASYFRGRTFLEVAELIYLRFGAQLFAVGVRTNPSAPISNHNFAILLNPAHYVIQGDEIGFVISVSSKVKEWIEKYGTGTGKKGEETDALLREEEGWGENGTYGAIGRSWTPEVKLPNKGEKEKDSEKVSGPDTIIVSEMDDDEKNEWTEDVDSSSAENPAYNGSTSRARLLYMPPHRDDSSDDESDVNHSHTHSSSRDATPSQANTNAHTPHHQRSQSFSAQTPGSDYATNPVPSTPVTPHQITNQNVRLARRLAALSTAPSIPTSVTRHLLLCDVSPTFPKNLEFFVGCLRGKEPEMDVVVLSPVSPDDETRIRLEALGRVWFVKGLGTVRKDLFRAGVERARKCVVLSDRKTYFEYVVLFPPPPFFFFLFFL